MSFLGIAFLFALPLAAAPLLLHLLDRRRNVAIDWGAMEFLVVASERKSSARRLKQWLLLLLRMLAIAALVFALARPLIPAGWLGSAQRGEIIFVVDNSMSTSRMLGKQTLVDAIAARAANELSDSSSGDRVRVMTTAPYPIWLGSGGARTGGLRVDAKTKAAIATQLQSIKATQGSSDLLAGLMTAVQAKPDPVTQHRRIVLLTDGQAADWRLTESEGWEQFRAALSRQSVATDLRIINITKEHPDANQSKRGNVAVDEVRLRRQRVGIGETIVASAIIGNHNLVESSNATSLTWAIDGKEVASGLVDEIDPRGSRDVSWTHSFDQPGAYRLTAHINTEDELPADDVASVIVEVVKAVPILIVEGQWELADTQQDSFFVRAALGRLDQDLNDPGDVSDGSMSIFQPTVVSDENLDRVDLNDFHVVVIPDLRSLDPRSIEALRSFVVDGGGLWVGLGPRTDFDDFNDRWFSGGSGLSPMSIDRIVDEKVSGNDQANVRPPVRVNPFGSEHPAVAQIADNQQSDLGDVVVERRVHFALSELSEQPSLLLSLSNGEPLAVEQFVGQGRVIVQGIPLRLQWSDLARSQSFVMMVHDWIDYLSEPRTTQFNLQPGDTIVYRSDAEEPAFSGMLTTPQDEAIELVSDGLGESVLRTNRTSLPGEYTLETTIAGESIPFQVARDNRESDLSQLDSGEQARLSDLSGIQPTNVGEASIESGPSDPLWPFLLLGLTALITMELVLSGILARERFGTSGLGEDGAQDEAEFSIPPSKFPDIAGSQQTKQVDTDSIAVPREKVAG